MKTEPQADAPAMAAKWASRCEHDKAHREATVAKLAARTGRQMHRPCPKSKLHKATGQIYVEFRLGDERRRVYLGSAALGNWVDPYAKFAEAWPDPLFDTPPPRPRPAPRLLTHDGRTQTLTAWARSVGLKRSVLAYRLDVLRWQLAKALLTPARSQGGCPRLQHDQASGRAFVRWRRKGKLLVKALGVWGSVEVEAAYQVFCARWAADAV